MTSLTSGNLVCVPDQNGIVSCSRRNLQNSDYNFKVEEGKYLRWGSANCSVSSSGNLICSNSSARTNFSAINNLTYNNNCIIPANGIVQCLTTQNPMTFTLRTLSQTSSTSPPISSTSPPTNNTSSQQINFEGTSYTFSNTVNNCASGNLSVDGICYPVGSLLRINPNQSCPSNTIINNFNENYQKLCWVSGSNASPQQYQTSTNIQQNVLKPVCVSPHLKMNGSNGPIGCYVPGSYMKRISPTCPTGTTQYANSYCKVNLS